MPMGTVGHVSNGTANLSRQSHPSFVSAYTNGDYAGAGQRWTSSSHPDDRIVSHGPGTDTNESRPASQGAGSATSGGAQSRPTTSQGMVSTSSLPLVHAVTARSRPESSGTELAPQPVMRHGFADAYSSEEYLNMLEQVHSPSQIYHADIRFFTCTSRLIVMSGQPHQRTRIPPSSKTGDHVND
jgi:hypothetical protein